MLIVDLNIFAMIIFVQNNISKIFRINLNYLYYKSWLITLKMYELVYILIYWKIVELKRL